MWPTRTASGGGSLVGGSTEAGLFNGRGGETRLALITCEIE